jgi:pilus assembly protein CpaF
MSQLQTPFGEVPESEASGWDLFKHYFEPLMPFYEDPKTTEIMVNRYDQVLVEQDKGMEPTDITFGSEENLQRLIHQLANRLGQQVDNDNPVLDARLPNGSRFCCTLPAVTPNGATITLRIAPRKILQFEDLLRFGALTQEMVDFLKHHVETGSNMVVSGNTGSGKTTLLRAMAAFINPAERVLSAEDTQELHLGRTLYNCVSMEAPKRRTDNPVTLAFLIKTMLRQRPDRGWVGEIRDAGAAEAFLQLLNTGHTGCATSLHANSCKDAVKRIQTLIASGGGLSYELAGHEVMGSLHLLVHAARTYGHGRKIAEICVVENETVKPVFIFDEKTGTHIRVGE